jgi:anthranilate phosphoribosyltransferase
MNEQINLEQVRSSALADGIKTVGVGKHGSTNCTPDQIGLILKDCRCGKINSAQLGAFFGALWMKGVTSDEMALNELFPEKCVDKPLEAVHYILKSTPEPIKEIVSKIIRNKILSYSEASKIGEYLFDEKISDDTAKAFIASALRVRYTDPVEYSALHNQIQKSFALQFKSKVTSIKHSKPILQMAEPFDGVDRSHLLTPILARHLVNKGYQVIIQAGRSSGPKFGLNLLDIAHQLDAQFLKGIGDLVKYNSDVKDEVSQSSSPKEYYVDQRDLSSALDKWVELRKIILKRPFLATLEKYVDPFGLNIFMASAFHHTFTDKMVEIAEEIGFPVIIITFRGVEGSLGLSLGRTAQIICSIRQADGSYIRKTIEANPESYGFQKEADPKLTNEEVAKNSELIKNYFEKNESGNSYFDKRVRYNIMVYEQVLNWITEHYQFI